MSELILAAMSVMGSGLRQATPLILVAMGGLMAERSGTVDIGLEGKLLFSAFTGAALASYLSMIGVSAPIALIMAVLGAIFSSVLLSWLHGFATMSQKGDHVISGLAINILASGLTFVLGQAIFAKGGQTPSLPDGLRFRPIELRGEKLLQDVPVLGVFYERVISGHHLLTYLALMSVLLTSFILYKTRFGLHVRAVGEEPNAVDTAGLSVVGLRYLALTYTGIMCGLAGVGLSMGQNAGFVKEMSVGMGFMALAAVIFGRWRPWPTLVTCLLFGFLAALSDRLQGVPLFGFKEIPSQFFGALPYILTVVLLAGFAGKSVAPKAIGRPYVKER